LLSIILLCVLSLMIASTVTIFTATDRLRAEILQNVDDRLTANMRVAWHLLNALGPPRLQDGQLYAGQTRLEGNTALVDEVQRLVGDEASIFRDDIRVATTIRVESGDGARAVGARLLQSAARAAELRAGVALHGSVDIPGEPYFAAYDPIKAADGSVIGALVVGFKQRPFMAALMQMRTLLLDTSLAGLFAIGLAFALLALGLGRQLRAREAQLAEVNLRLDTALESMKQGLCFISSDQRVLLANRRYAEIYALPPEAIKPGTSFEQIAKWRAMAGTSPRDAEAHSQKILSHMARGMHTGNMVLNLKNGQVIAIHYRHMADGAWIATHDDVTATLENEARLNFLARHDPLTGLPNRTLFLEKLAEALANLAPGASFALHCLDLDDFKIINETLGHPVGDRLLQTVATRLRTCLHESDILARLGGDEFAIIQFNLTRPDDAANFATGILASIAVPYDIQDHRLETKTSIGIALAPSDAADVDNVLKHADTALHWAKAEGRARFRFFEAAMNAALQLRHSLEADLRVALAQQQLELFYQPMLDIPSNDVIGFEALLRWRHPERGLIPPLDFIPLAEETGLIVPIGTWVLQQACREAAGWPVHIRVAVNVSAVQFRGDGLVSAVQTALATSGLSPARLELEITESILLQNSEVNLTILRALAQLGVRVSLDDFGTGYASLGYLRNFRFDTLKIDQSFVRDMADSADCETIVRAIANLGRSLGMRVLAEGVETSPQLDTLRAIGCHSAQGYLFSRPRPAGDITALLAERSAA
jgi:diguanylate cyclase (GGDEF)-like protein